MHSQRRTNSEKIQFIEHTTRHNHTQPSPLLPPCTKSLPPADAKPLQDLGGGRVSAPLSGIWSIPAESVVQVWVPGLNSTMPVEANEFMWGTKDYTETVSIWLQCRRAGRHSVQARPAPSSSAPGPTIGCEMCKTRVATLATGESRLGGEGMVQKILIHSEVTTCQVFAINQLQLA